MNKTVTIPNTTNTLLMLGMGTNFPDYTDSAKLVSTLQWGLDNGIQLIDTAENYSKGQSEEVVGRAIAGKRDKAFVATKVSPENFSYHSVIKSAEASLKRLKTDYIDLYQLHWPNPSIPLVDTMQALLKLKNEGKIRYIGLSNYCMTDLIKASYYIYPDNGLISMQSEYSLVNRYVENNVLPFCLSHNFLFFAYSPLAKGKFLDSVFLSEISRVYGKTPAQTALNWIMCNRAVPIVMASSIEHLKENLEATQFSIDGSQLASLSKATIFSKQPEWIYPRDILVETANLPNYNPPIIVMASALMDNGYSKPIRVKREGIHFRLVEGRSRLLAWTSAFGYLTPILAYIDN